MLARRLAGSATAWLGQLAVCIGTVVLVFLLPLTIPVHYRQTLSTSYVAGYNNAAGISFTVAISLVVFLASVWKRTPGRNIARSPELKLRSLFVIATVATTSITLAAISLLVIRSHLPYLVDSGYFIEAVTVRLDKGRSLYSQMEFAYGPLLLMPEVWLARAFHIPPAIAYYLVYVCEFAAGLLLLVWIMNQLPIQLHLRKWALLLFAIGGITPHLGLNYTFVRFGAPVAVLLWGTQRRSAWQSAVCLVAGQALVAFLSPELAIAMISAIAVFAIARMLLSGTAWLWTALGPGLALVVSLAILGRPYLHTAEQFSHGSFNLPIGPYPHIIVFLIAAVWLVPRLFRNRVDVRSPAWIQLLTLYVFGLALLPAALGRCDPLHVLFDGTPLMILSLVSINDHSKAVQRAWLCAFAVMVVWNHRVNDRFFTDRTADVLRVSVMSHFSARAQGATLAVIGRVSPNLAAELDPSQHPEVPVDIAELTHITNGQPIATPLVISPAIENQLRDAHINSPGYYEFWVDVLSPAAELRVIADMNTNKWALLPLEDRTYHPEMPTSLHALQGMTFPYRVRNPVPYNSAYLFQTNLAQHWTLARNYGAYLLYRKNAE